MNNTKELSYRNYKSLGKLNNISFKGGLRWFLCYLAFLIPSSAVDFFNTSYSGVMSVALYTYIFMVMYTNFDRFANPPQLVSTAPISRKKIVQYDLIETFMEFISFIPIWLIIWIVETLIFSQKIQPIKFTKANIMGFIVQAIFIFLIYPLCYIKSKKRFYIQSMSTAAIFIAVIFLLKHFSDSIKISTGMIIVAASLLVISMISAYFISVKNAEMKQ